MASDKDVRPRFEETTGNKTARKIRENPMVPIGMAGFFAAVVYGIRNYKKRPKTMTLSMYIMRFRVFAQSIAVGAMGLGIGYAILREQFKPTENPEEAKKKKT
ncbi:unnamed protein product [Candidula unifasciata]|uniref:HIG1 domain-containing protein n=1 Tax=Candidula unifasciata TaxID=100452 RepID=A0A8S4A270_9EUPU|nr:unnamed protein product [Candidula unifasciata]